jgi:hypothetical protein
MQRACAVTNCHSEATPVGLCHGFRRGVSRNTRLQERWCSVGIGLALVGLRRNEDDAKETLVPEKSAARHTPSNTERDTLPAMDPQFLRDQLEALLSSPEGVSARHGSNSQLVSRHLEWAESDGSAHEDDTEPSIDTRLLRDAILAAGKSA